MIEKLKAWYDQADARLASWVEAQEKRLNGRFNWGSRREEMSAFISRINGRLEGLGQLVLRLLSLIPFVVIVVAEIFFGHQQSFRQQPLVFNAEWLTIAILLAIYGLMMAVLARRNLKQIAWRVLILLAVGILTRTLFWFLNTNQFAGLTPGGALNRWDSTWRVAIIALLLALGFVFWEVVATIGDRIGNVYNWVKDKIFPLLEVLFQFLNWFDRTFPGRTPRFIAAIGVALAGWGAAQFHIFGLFLFALLVIIVLWLMGRNDPELKWTTPLSAEPELDAHYWATDGTDVAQPGTLPGEEPSPNPAPPPSRPLPPVTIPGDDDHITYI